MNSCKWWGRAAIGLTVGILLGATASAQSNEGTIFLTGGVYPCQGHDKSYVHTWANPWGPTYLTGGFVWVGTGRGLRSDVGFQLYIIRPGDVPEGESAEAYYTRGVCVY